MVTSRAMEISGNMTRADEDEVEMTPSGMTRREAARRLLGAVSAGTLFPFHVAGHPIWKHLADDALMDTAGAAVAEGAHKFLNAQQYASVVAISESMVPGSTKAKVAEFVDLLLDVDSKTNQTEFVESLGQIESESQKKFTKGFAALSESQKSELLTAMESSAAFKNLKTWVSGAYYSSEIGMRELGWTPTRFFPQFPGCEQASEHASD